MGSWRPSSRYTTARLLFNLAAGDCRAATGATMGFIVGLKEAWESFNRRRSAKSIFLQVSHECLWLQFEEMKDEANEMDFFRVSSRFCAKIVWNGSISDTGVVSFWQVSAWIQKHFRKSMTTWRKLLKWLGSKRVIQLLIKFFLSNTPRNESTVRVLKSRSFTLEMRWLTAALASIAFQIRKFLFSSLLSGQKSPPFKEW